MRLFIALPLSPEIRSSIEKTMEDWKKQGIEGRFVRNQNLHITLAFIGEYDNVQAVKDVLASMPGMQGDLCLDGIGHFGSLYYYALKKDACLERYAALLRKALQEAGIPCDPKPFKGHITLIRQAKVPKGTLIRAPELCFQAQKPVLFQSVVKDENLYYNPLFIFE